jgi:hypothetical protein
MKNYAAGDQLYNNAENGDFIQIIVSRGFGYGGWGQQDELIDWNENIVLQLKIVCGIEYCRKLSSSEIEQIDNINFDYDADDFATLNKQRLSRRRNKNGIRHDVKFLLGADSWWFDFEIIILRKRVDGSWSVVRSQGYDFLSTEVGFDSLIKDDQIRQRKENDEYEKKLKIENLKKIQIQKKEEERNKRENDGFRYLIIIAIFILFLILLKR